MGRAADAALAAAHVDHLAGVFFHVDAGDAHACRVAFGGTGHVFRGLPFFQLRHDRTFGGALAVDVQIKPAPHAKGLGALRGLEVLRHVGIHVALAIEHGVLFDIAVSCQAGEHDILDGRLVGHGQGTRQAQADRAGMGVGLRTELQLASAEHFGVQLGQLAMDLQADNRLPVLQDLFHGLHAIHRPSRPPRPQNRGQRRRTGIRAPKPQRHGACSHP